MARGNNASRVRARNPSCVNNNNNMQTNKPHSHVQSTQNMHEVIDRHFDSMPKEARAFLLQNARISLHSLAKFWSRPGLIEYTRGGIAGGVCGASLFIGLSYMKLGMLPQAKAMTLNGAFILQCVSTSIESIMDLCGPDFDAPILSSDAHTVPLYIAGCRAVHDVQSMETYLTAKLPPEYQHMMESFVKTNSNHVMEYVTQIGDDWGGGNSPAMKSASSKSSSGSKIELFLQDDVNTDERQGFSIDSATTLRTLFNDYADKRGVSLRSLRFSYNGKTLFLSSVGNKTADELLMRHQDVIIVHDTSASQELTTAETNKQSNKAAKSNRNKSTKKSKGKSKKKKQPNRQQETTESIEQCKALHSKTLTKLHEEAEPQLKEIRMRLNALDLERQPPKQKKRKNKKKSRQYQQSLDYQRLPSSGIGGKAGKPYFNIHVGEVSNLYKTTKPSQQQKPTSTPISMLDLHGFTQEESLQKLDESLATWVDDAMQGSYPFVIPAKIVCGCGNQVLSELVETWIRDHAQVANSPKSHH